MKKIITVTAAILALSSPIYTYAMDHSGHEIGHKTTAAHEEVINGVKATFNIQTMVDAMKAMGMDMPKGVKDTHHISVNLKDAKTGKALTEGDVSIKVQNPDKSFQNRDLKGMHGHFGADFEFNKSGNYGIMCKFLLKDGQTRQTKFWYAVK